ncbi:MAG: MBL fold metallo-hydrolase [Spirochaetaceae bacterium]|nr:MAG: MBL fold metallo-hydrolase [Spirochaetaceae bacterium]
MKTIRSIGASCSLCGCVSIFHRTMVERIIVGPLFTNTYLVATSKKGCVIVDPGADVDLIAARLEAMNMKPHAIVLTHGHLDHTAAAAELKRRFGGIPVCIHPNDANMLANASRREHLESFRGLAERAEEAVDRLLRSLPDPDILLEDGAEVPDSDLQVIHTPGHTPGSVCFYSEPRGALFSGDTLHLTAGTEGLPGGDRAQLIASITDRIFPLPGETRLFPGHGPISSIEREMLHNDGLRETAGRTTREG